jgi:general secretion pathway protein A
MADYNTFYGFSENPFETSPDPKFFFQSESHSEALASLLYGINQRKGFVLVLGEAGTGKTTLIHHLINTLDEKVKTILIPESQIPFAQILKDMLLQLGLPLGLGNKGSMMHELYYHLIQCLHRDENVVVIIDEAENIGLDEIEEVRLLANLETSTSKLLQIVLVGRPALREKLLADVIRQIKQRIVISCEINPLTEEESIRYIEHRLKIAGSASSEVCTDEALSLICRYAKGVPLAINTLCSNALSLGCGLAERKVSPSTVKKVRSEKNILNNERTEILVSGMKRYTPQKKTFIILTLIISAMVLFFGWSHVQTLFNTQEPNPSVIQPAVEDNVKAPSLAVQAHALGENVPDSPGPHVTDAPLETPQIPSSPLTALGRPDTEIRLKEIVEVRAGASLYALAYKYYQEAHETFIDHILKLNPEITNPNLILVNQKIKIPEITDSLLIVQYSKGLYKVHLKTFANFKRAKQYKSGIALKGKEIEIVPWKVSPGVTWYRVMAGPFGDRTEGSKAIAEMHLQ